jgi:hypothetical protein
LKARSTVRATAIALIASSALLLGGCATVEDAADEPEPVYVPAEDVVPPVTETVTVPAEEPAGAAAGDSAAPEPPVVEPAPAAPVPGVPPPSGTAPVPGAPATVPGPGTTPPPATPGTVPPPPTDSRSSGSLGDILVTAPPRRRDEEIRDLVAEAKALLKDVELKFVFTGKGRRETLRGRPVAFALWNEATKKWTVAHVEIPRPPVKWKPGGKPMPFRMLTPGVTAQHVKGTGAERLMFAFYKGNQPLKVYGRKFPVFDNTAIAKRRWRAAVASAKHIVYLPFTEDTLDPSFVQGGREFLLATANKAIAELRAANVPSIAFPGQLLADVVPPELITTLAVIEQTDDADYTRKQAAAFEEVLSQYGLKREEAYRYSISRAGAVGAMQFTNRRGNGTYSYVVRRCPAARIDPNFERGATDLKNAMKAAICLFDIELARMSDETLAAYWNNKRVLGIFPVAAYNGGPRNVTKLQRVIDRMNVELADLRPPGQLSPGSPIVCPCLWVAAGDGVRPVSIPRYNNENRWYVQKYQSVMRVFESDGAGATQ